MSSRSSLLSARVRARAVQLAVLTLSLTSAAAPAQAQGDVDLKMVSAYTLTMPKYKQYLDATVNLANVAAKDPGLAKRLDGFGNQPLAEQVKLLEATPQLRGAIMAAGLTARDFVLTQGAMLQAGMAYALTKQGSLPPDSAIKKAGVSRANLEFFQKNEAELGRLAKEAAARAPKLPADEEEPAE
jgi:hypothetical protein